MFQRVYRWRTGGTGCLPGGRGSAEAALQHGQLLRLRRLPGAHLRLLGQPRQGARDVIFDRLMAWVCAVVVLESALQVALFDVVVTIS